MRAILKKARADILSRPMISLLVLITIATSATLLTLALATLMNVSAPYDRAFEQLNAAHVWVYLDRQRATRSDVERIRALPGVVQSTELRYHVTTRADLRGDRVAVSVRAIPSGIPDVNRLLVREGRRLSPRRGELLASTDLDDLYKLSVGETVGLARGDGKEVHLPVVGLAYNAMWDTYRSDQPPYVYVSEDTLRELCPDQSMWGWSVGLRLSHPHAVPDTVARIESALHGDLVESYTDWRDVRRAAVFGARMNFIFLGAFAFFAILATVLVIASSIGSIVLSQFKQIGILKTIGFTRQQILWLYLGEYLILSLIGTPIGLLVGIALSPFPLKSVAVSLNTPFRPPFTPSLAALVFSLVSAVVTIATLGGAYRGSQANIIKSMAVGAEAPRRSFAWGTWASDLLNLPIVLTLGLTDLFARPFRSLMTGLNLMLGVIGMVFGLTLNDTLHAYRADPALLGLVQDATVTRQTTSHRKTEHLLNQAPDVVAYYSEALLKAESQQGQSFHVRAVEGDLAAFPFQIHQGRFFQPDTYEAVAGRGLLKALGLQVGDDVTITFDRRPDRPVTWHIVGQYPEPTNLGEAMMVSLPTAARSVRGVEPDTYFLKLSQNARTAGLKEHLKRASSDDLNIVLTEQAIPDDVLYLQLAILALAVILIVIALINVFNTSLLAVQEKTREIGILKTVGMTPAQVVTMVNTSAGLLGLTAAIIGIPLGFCLTKQLLGALSEIYGFGEVHVALNTLYAALLVPLMILVSITGSVIPGRRAASLSIVRVLRDE